MHYAPHVLALLLMAVGAWCTFSEGTAPMKFVRLMRGFILLLEIFVIVLMIRNCGANALP